MAQPSSADVPLPRNFKLLAEYEACIGKEPHLVVGEHTGLIQYGMDDSKEDPLLHYWQGIIFGPQGKQTGELMYQFEVFCSDKYPEESPRIRFKGPKVSMKAVDSQGYVNLTLLTPPFKWSPRMNISDALCAVRSNMGESGVANASFPLRHQNYF